MQLRNRHAAARAQRGPGEEAAEGESQGAKKDERRRAGVTEGDAVVSRGRSRSRFSSSRSARPAATRGATRTSRSRRTCSSASAGRGDAPRAPRSARFAIADAGQRVEREVALWWPERRTLMEVAAHDAVLDFAWKDLSASASSSIRSRSTSC